MRKFKSLDNIKNASVEELKDTPSMNEGAAQKVYEKIGFHLEGILRNELLTRTGHISDLYYYGLLKHELRE